MTELIVALDTPSIQEAINIINQTKDRVKIYKLGPKYLLNNDERFDTFIKTFIDLKFYDIPETVSAAVKNICNWNNCSMFTVHASGGKEMMEAAVKAKSVNTLTLAVTVLTSFSETAWYSSTDKSIAESVLDLAWEAHHAKMDGIVCSGWEAHDIKTNWPEFITVVPGIRLEDTKDDQKRVSTPENVKEVADYIVVGRPIMQADNPSAVVDTILERLK